MNEKTKNALLSIVASLVCIVIGLLVGFIILYCINAENAVDGFTRIIKGGFYLKPKGIGSEIAQSAPLIMTGLSVAFAFKTGLFNIGAAGQYTIGVFGACILPSSSTCHGMYAFWLLWSAEPSGEQFLVSSKHTST